MRRATVVVCALLIVAVGVGATAAIAADPIKEPSAADKRRARTVLIRAADVGAGWRSTPATPSPDDDLECPGYNPDLSDLIQTTDERGPDLSFDDGLHSYEVFSSADAYRTAEMLEAAWARESRPAIIPCYKRTLAASLRQSASDAGVEAPKITWVTSKFFTPTANAPKRLGLELQAKFSVIVDGARVTLNFRLRFVGLGSGRGEAGVGIVSYFAKAPDSLEASLVAKLDKRLARAFPP